MLESLVPALAAATVPAQRCRTMSRLSRPRASRRVKLIDATPIGINVRSTVATYAGVHDELRKVYARSPEAKADGYKAGDFSYNTGSAALSRLRRHRALSAWMCSSCRMWTIPCPDCRGSRYAREA